MDGQKAKDQHAADVEEGYRILVARVKAGTMKRPTTQLTAELFAYVWATSRARNRAEGPPPRNRDADS